LPVRPGGRGPGTGQLINSVDRGDTTKVFLTGNKKKPEVTEKHVYRIYRKILGFDILFSDEI